MIYLLVLISLNLSCVEQKPTEKEVNKVELVSTSKTDTLKFTSGIRAIFKDSKGNYWFGSHKETVEFISLTECHLKSNFKKYCICRFLGNKRRRRLEFF